MTKNALNSLYGEGHAQATDEGKGIRNQEVLTPQGIVDGLLKFWPEGILYDASSDVGEHIPCEDGTGVQGLMASWPDRTYCNPPYGVSLFDPAMENSLWEEEKRIRQEAKANKVAPKFPHGLPLKKAGLKDWLKMQLIKSEGESIMLVPNRTHRKWFRGWKRKVTAMIELDPVTFHGWSSSCPFPLVLGLLTDASLGWRAGRPSCEMRVRDFHEAFAHVGDPA